MLLQIPVVGGHTGGAINLSHRGNLKSFPTHAESKRRFSLLAFHSFCQQELEPITSGAMALLVVRLLWTNAPIGTLFSPIDHPAFIEALTDINGCFNRLAWNSTSAEDLDHSDDSCYDACGSECGSKCSCHNANDADDPYHRDHQGEEGFFFFLKNSYKAGPTFSSLKGEDCQLALLFRCFPSIKVHLTVVEQKFDEELQIEGWSDGDDDEPLLTASNWIHPEIGPVNLSGMEGYPRGRLIHKELTMHEEPEDRQPDREVEDPDSGYSRSTYLTPALCIWPKEESIAMHASYGFDALLNRMESSSFDGYGALEGLGKLLNAIQRKPSGIWIDPVTGGADRAERLLRLCVKLRAKNEGLRLLRLLSNEFQGSNSRDAEGIRDDAVALAIAEF